MTPVSRQPRAASVRLDSGGVLVLALGLVVTAAGVLAERPIVALWGECLLGALLIGWLVATYTASELQRELELICLDVRSGRGALLAREPAIAEFSLRAPSIDPDAVIELTLVTTRGLAFGPLVTTSVLDDRRLLTATGRALAAGPAFLHGTTVAVAIVGGAFRFHTYLPIGKALRVLPKAASLRPDRIVGGNDLRQAVLTSNRRVRGPGADVRELRDHVPGDPFKHIAWKASARRGRLVVKSFDDEATVSVYVLLDVGPAMRTGPIGETRLDHAVESIMGLAAGLGRSHDRFGLVTYDQRVLGFTRADSGPKMLEPVVAHLVETHAVVHSGFTEDSADDVAARLARFLEAQDGQALRLPGTLRFGTSGGDIDVGRMHDLVQRAFAAEPRAHKPLGDPAADPIDRDLRLYCRARGVELPYRAEIPGEDRSAGLLGAIERCLRDGSAGHIFVVVTDLADLTAAAVAPAIRLAAAHRHQLLFWSPEARRSPPPAAAGAAPARTAPALQRPAPLSERLADLLLEARAERRRHVAAELTALGVRAIIEHASGFEVSRSNRL